MELTLIRRFDDKDATTGHLFVDGKLFCVTLEDEYREKFLDKNTRIPAGRYEIKFKKGSPMGKRYLDKYGTDGMPWLQDVPGFTWIYIHIGNYEQDTEGCILVGKSITQSVKDGFIKQNINSSTDIYLQLHKLIATALEDRKEEVWIHIVDNS